MLDVFFISMGEHNCEKNWQRLLTFVPDAQRVSNIVGIYNVHEACAKLSKTDNFWVVDADAWIVDGFDFLWEPNPALLTHGIPETDCAVIWPSINPVNDLVYGYGAVKVFPRRPFLEKRAWTVDMTSSITPGLISKDIISCETRFNATAESAWIGAFRECVKLSSLVMLKSRIKRVLANEQAEFAKVMQFTAEQAWTDDKKLNYRKVQNMLITEKYKNEKHITQHWDEIELYSARALTWCTVGIDQRNGRPAMRGAQAGTTYGLQNGDDIAALNLINDWNWLKEEYKKSVNI